MGRRQIPHQRSVYQFAAPLDSYPSTKNSLERALDDKDDLEREVRRLFSENKEVQTDEAPQAESTASPPADGAVQSDGNCKGTQAG